MLLFAITQPNDFLAEQKKFIRVRTAIEEKQSFIEEKLKEHKITSDNLNILIVAYKEDDCLMFTLKQYKKQLIKKFFHTIFAPVPDNRDQKGNKVMGKCLKDFIT